MTYSKPAATSQRLTGLLTRPSICDCQNPQTKDCKLRCDN